MTNLNNAYFILSGLLLKIVITFSTSTQYSYLLSKNYNGTDCDDFWVSKINEKFKQHEINQNKTLTIKRNIPKIINSYNNKVPAKIDKSAKPWYLSLPLLPVLFATSPQLPDGNCKQQAQRYLQELAIGTLWAVRMFDSSTKYPEGIITGHTRHYGNFDECYRLNAKIPAIADHETNIEVINGKYCLVKVEYHKPNNSNIRMGPYTLEFDPNGSVWDAIKEKGDFRRVKRYLLELALCVPDACSALDIEKALQKPLEDIGAQQHIVVKTAIRGQCQTQKDEPEFSIWAKLYCYTILGLFLVVGAGTWYDTTENTNDDNKSLVVDVLLCFSAKKNYKSITEITYTHPGLDSIHLIRFVLMCMGIFGHRFVQYYTNPMVNSEYLEYTYTLPISIILYNGPIIVDSFFAFGGLLLAYFLLLELDKNKKINFMAAILIRYIRLTPSYLMIIMFVALVLPHLGSGPYWDYKIGLESNSCADNWWTNLLYINNYVNTDKSCIFQSWYMSVDYHLYIIALFIIYFFWKMPRSLGYPFLISVIIAGCIIPFCLSYFYQVQPMYMGLPYMHEVREDPYFVNHYIKTHERLSSYFVGVLAGAIIYDHSLSPWKIPKPWSRILFIILSVMLSIKSQSLGMKFYDPNIISTPMEAGLYACLNRPTFALAIVSIVVLLTVGDGLDFHHKFFKPRWAQPVARLTYGVYLIHNINQSYDIGVIRQARMFSIHNAIWDLVPDVVFSLLLSLMLALLVEGPFRRLEKRLITRQLKHSKSIVNNNATMNKAN